MIQQLILKIPFTLVLSVRSLFYININLWNPVIALFCTAELQSMHAPLLLCTLYIIIMYIFFLCNMCILLFIYTVSNLLYCVFIQPFNRQIFQSEFSPTWCCVSLTRSTTSSEWKLFRFDKNGGQLFSNIADWCHILSLTCLKGGT